MELLLKIKRLINNKVIKGGCELFLVIISVFVVSYAWFVKTTKNQTDDLTIKTKASRLLYISLDDGLTWSTELSLNLDDKFKFNNEVTGNGVNFYKAATKRDDGIPITFKEATAGSDYLEFDLLFKANAPLGVFLDSDSYVIPSVGIEYENLIGDTVFRKSAYGNFSRDLIAGALRISFTENSYVDGEYISNLKSSLVWAPNKNYELVYNNGIYTFDINSSNKQDYRYIDSTNGYEYKVIDNFKDNLNTDFDNDFANGDPMITKIDPNFNGGIKSVTVRIWVEGNDRETHDALTGGLFKLNINFMGIVKENRDDIPVVTSSGKTIEGFNEGMEYSKDNGNNWVSYKQDNAPTFKSGDVVLVRFSEDDNFYASECNKIEF